MIVYHGSYTKIEEIDLSKSIPNKDFGKGFYVTKFKKHAEEWSVIIGNKYNTQGFVTEFIFYDAEFTERLCKVKHFDGYTEEWLDFVVENRNPLGNSHDYDIIEGPVADDKIQNKITDYLNKMISKPDFLEILKWHEQTHQICFCTTKSLLTLQRKDQKRISILSHIGEPIVEKLVTDYGFDEQTASDKFFTSQTFTKVSDTSTEFFLKDWTEIYEVLLSELKLK